MAYWTIPSTKQVTGRNKQPIKLSDGVNKEKTIFDLSDSEAWEAINTSNRVEGALSVKYGRSAYSTAITTPNGAGVYNNTYHHVVDGTTWKRWDGSAYQNVATGLTNTTAKFLEFNTVSARYILMFNGTEKKVWDGTTVTDLTDAPATKLITVDDYRIYAVNGSILYCSAANSVTDWTTSGDADTIPLTGMVGTATALSAYKDQTITWSEQTMHILYGNDTGDFYLSDPEDHGCISDRSVIRCNDVLYFLDFGKYKAFSSGNALEISQKIRPYLEEINLTYKTSCVAGSQGKYVYLSIPYGASTTNNYTFEFDTKKGTWYVWNEGYVNFFNIGEGFYGITPTGTIYQLNTGTTNNGTAISWSHTTGMMFRGFNKIAVDEIPCLIDLPSGSTLTVSYNTRVNSASFATLYTFTSSSDLQSVPVYIATDTLYDVDYYQLKFAGTGPCTIHFVGTDEVINVR